MEGMIIAAVVVLVALVVLALVIFRPSKGFKPETKPSGYTMSADKPLVLRYPGGPLDSAEGEVRDVLHRAGDAPVAAPPASDATNKRA